VSSGENMPVLTRILNTIR